MESFKLMIYNYKYILLYFFSIQIYSKIITLWLSLYRLRINRGYQINAHYFFTVKHIEAVPKVGGKKYVRSICLKMTIL